MTAAEKINLEVIGKTTQYKRGHKTIWEEGEDWTTANGWEKWKERKNCFKGEFVYIVTEAKGREFQVPKKGDTESSNALEIPRMAEYWESPGFRQTEV